MQNFEKILIIIILIIIIIFLSIIINSLYYSKSIKKYKLAINNSIDNHSSSNIHSINNQLTNNFSLNNNNQSNNNQSNNNQLTNNFSLNNNNQSSNNNHSSSNIHSINNQSNINQSSNNNNQLSNNNQSNNNQSTNNNQSNNNQSTNNNQSNNNNKLTNNNNNNQSTNNNQSNNNNKLTNNNNNNQSTNNIIMSDNTIQQNIYNILKISNKEIDEKINNYINLLKIKGINSKYDKTIYQYNSINYEYNNFDNNFNIYLLYHFKINLNKNYKKFIQTIINNGYIIINILFDYTNTNHVYITLGSFNKNNNIIFETKIKKKIFNMYPNINFLKIESSKFTFSTINILNKFLYSPLILLVNVTKLILFNNKNLIKINNDSIDLDNYLSNLNIEPITSNYLYNNLYNIINNYEMIIQNLNYTEKGEQIIHPLIYDSTKPINIKNNYYTFINYDSNDHLIKNYTLQNKSINILSKINPSIKVNSKSYTNNLLIQCNENVNFSNQIQFYIIIPSYDIQFNNYIKNGTLITPF